MGMTSRGLSVCVSVSFAAAGVLGLSACSSDKPSGLAPFTPSAPGSSSSSSPSPTISSRWTLEQQQVIAGYDAYSALMARFRTKAEKINLAKARRVSQEPFIRTHLQQMDHQIAAGYVEKGKAVDTILSVTVVGSTATLKTCLDPTHMKLVNPGNPSARPVKISPPNLVDVSLVRVTDSWLVAGLKDGGGGCVSG
jgi:hypothetical protein